MLWKLKTHETCILHLPEYVISILLHKSLCTIFKSRRKSVAYFITWLRNKKKKKYYFIAFRILSYRQFLFIFKFFAGATRPDQTCWLAFSSKWLRTQVVVRFFLSFISSWRSFSFLIFWYTICIVKKTITITRITICKHLYG